MFKKTYILFLVVFSVFLNFKGVAADSCPKIRRICRDNINRFDNTIFWSFPSKTPCGVFKEYRIYARQKSFDPFTVIGTVTDINVTSFVHLNANIPRNLPWDYFIEVVYDCPPTTFLCYSDTQNVTDFDLLKSVIAYISIDHKTNRAFAVWEKNSSEGFWYVDVFNESTALANFVSDTFFIDNISGGNPKAGPLKYVIAAVDSCSNRWSFISSDYHASIHLSGIHDTCEKEVKLSWTKYVGWGEDISFYKLYKRINGGSYSLLGTFDKSTFSFIDKSTGNYFAEYYIEAQKAISPFYKSNSNLASFNLTRKEDNADLKINAVTTDPIVKISFSYNFLSDVSFVELLKSSDNHSFFVLKEFVAKNEKSVVYEDNLQPTGEKAFYKLVSKNSCRKPLASSNSSANIVLEKDPLSFGEKLVWNNYFTWNLGIENYDVYRQTLLDGNEIAPFAFKKRTRIPFYTEEDQEEFYNGENYCYYIIAREKGDTNVSKSNIVCVDGPLKIYFPNAVTTEAFKPKGINIDYQKSFMTIFNRWGVAVKQNVNLETGWDLTDFGGSPAQNDTYFYKAEIVGLNGQEVKKSGTITILR